MAGLPSGTVTFLLTDIEGSTRLSEQQPEAMRAALRRHDALIAAGSAAHGGTVVKSRGEGDSCFVVFAQASDAAAAALALQQALLAEPWPTTLPLRVRMALHTGEAELRSGDYYGAAVNRCARLRAAAHGGQILLSGATAGLVRDALPPGVSLRDFGEHRLRDLIRPERVFQLFHPALPTEFPPLLTLDHRPNNLPLQATALVGRELEVEAVRQRLLRPDVRMLVLTGPGGTGKTRLGLQVAAELLDAFADGAWFVPLAPISDPALVASAIAQALGLREGARPLTETLKDSLGDKELLLVLDNFEQVLPAGALLGELLASCPKPKILVTSRAVLHVYGEHDFAVPPLRLPGRHPPFDRLTECEAARLFIERAQAAKADFVITNENAPAVAEICHRLDGLPLAIELAAARIRLLPPAALLARLERRLPLLTGGAANLPARQQTLRDTIDWSHDLLGPSEQQLFRRLAVFVGGCALEAAEAVCGAAVLDGLASLLDKSLLRQEETAGGEARFVMLETIREYALERLTAGGEAAALQRRHAAFFLDLAEEAGPKIHSPEQAVWLDRLEADHDNLRAALSWSLTEAGDGETALRLAGALSYFWELRGHLSEGRGWLERALALGGAPGLTRARATALHGAGVLAWSQGDDVAARRLLEESVPLFRAVGDRWGAAFTLFHLGNVALISGDYPAARARYDESLVIFRETGDPWGPAQPLEGLGRVALQEGDYAAARAALEASLAIRRQVGDTWLVAQSLNTLGDVARCQGDYERARVLYEESLALFRGLGTKAGIASLLHNLGYVAEHRGDHGRALALFRESLALFRELGDKRAYAECLAGLGGVAAGLGQAEQAARLFGAAEGLLESVGARMWPSNLAEYERSGATARARLGDEAFAAARLCGRTTPPDDVLGCALAALGPAAATAAGPPEATAGLSSAPLTPREREIAILIARGLTNRQIAERLVIATPTAERHVANILNKLGLTSRAQVAAWAVERGLLAAYPEA